MLPDDPVLRGRLFHAVRALLGWTQTRVAGEAGVSTAAVTALEVGRRGPRAGSVAAITAALERAEVRFLAAADGLGQGVRYERPEPARRVCARPSCTRRPEWPTRAAWPTPPIGAPPRRDAGRSGGSAEPARRRDRPRAAA